ncbi:MAG: polysaccharide biosynthesis/export family protein [Terracidiphilus sp.]|jgi:polysaccharide export outer membrane protein
MQKLIKLRVNYFLSPLGWKPFGSTDFELVGFSMKRISMALAWLTVAVAMSAACQSGSVAARSLLFSAPAASTDATTGLHERNPRYQLRKGDSFDIEFAFSPEFNQTVTLQPDGYITLKSVGSIFVEGLTVPELTETLRGAYAKILHDPVITVSPRDLEKPYFIAAGQVGRPGKYELRSALTVTEAVAIAGGFTDKSKHSQVAVYRPVADGGFEVKVLNVKKLLASHNLSEDLRLQPGDVVYVPQNGYSKIRPYIPTPAAGGGVYYNPAF